MKTSSGSKAAAKSASTLRTVSKGSSTKAKARARSRKSETNVAITTELAPAVAIALLEKTDHSPDSPAPALECLAAGVSSSEDNGKVRVQLVFENGAVLPVEMSVAAGAALSNGLSKELAPDK